MINATYLLHCLQVELPPNPYNQGFLRNLSEVLWWEQHFQQASERMPQRSFDDDDSSDLNVKSSSVRKDNLNGRDSNRVNVANKKNR